MKKMLIWESHSMISGGQKMTLLVTDMLKDSYEYVYLIPEKGALSEALDQRNIPYYLLGNQEMPAGIKGISVLFRYAALTISAVSKGITAIKKEKPDIIYAPGPAALPWSAICGALTRKPVIWHLHHVFLDGPTKKLLNIFSSCKSVKKIIAVSECVGDQINKEQGKKKVHVLYNPVDYMRYSTGNADVLYHEYPEAKHKDDDEIIIGHVALMQETKRQEVVIDTVRELVDRGYKARGFLVGGTKNAEDEKYLARLKKKSNAMPGLISFLGYRSDVENVLKCVDLVMIPSAFEGFPLAGLEANSAGIPVICADEGGSLEYAKVSKAGNIFEFDNARSAVDAVIATQSNYAELQANAVEFAKAHDISSYANEIAPLFRGAIVYS